MYAVHILCNIWFSLSVGFSISNTVTPVPVFTVRLCILVVQDLTKGMLEHCFQSAFYHVVMQKGN